MNFLIFVLFAHWASDFVLQSDKMAVNKSKSLKWLGIHILTYSFGMLAFMLTASLLMHYTLSSVFLYVFVNAIAHFGTDAITSRMTSNLYAKGDRHNFFVVIGLDQLIHTATLFWTLPILN